MLEQVIIVALCVLFLHICTWEGMIFHFIHSSLWGLRSWLKKPLYDCPVCMAIWWGPAIIAIGIIGKMWQVSNVYQLAIVITAAAAVNAVLIYLINADRAEIKALKNGNHSTGSDSE